MASLKDLPNLLSYRKLNCFSHRKRIVSHNNFRRTMAAFFGRNIEIFLWSFALLFLVFINPDTPQPFSFCLFHNLGIEFCPGCGLGRSISYFLHGNVVQSFNTHIVGIPAVCILIHRIIFLFVQHYRTKRNNLGQARMLVLLSKIKNNVGQTFLFVQRIN